MRRIVLGDNLDVLPQLPDALADLIYVDPPFNTGRQRVMRRLRTLRDPAGDRSGFGGHRYRTEALGTTRFGDSFDDYPGFLRPRLVHAHRLLKPHGSLFLHVDPRESHYCKIELDRIFGRESFMNEIVWAYDYGGRSRRRWAAKHDTIFWYARDPENYTFERDAIERIPYAAPGLVGPEKAARGKLPTDVWWHTIVPTHSKERTGYAAQKPLGVVRRIVRAHSRPGDLCLDFFAGSGTLGEAAARDGRDFLLIDSNPDAVEIMRKRLAFADPEILVWPEEGS